MTREEIIAGLEFTVAMFLFDPSTGETYTEPRNDMDKTTIDACRGAIKELKDNSYELWKESYEVEHKRNIRLEEKIEALEQEPVLDKIKAEIEEEFEGCDICEWFDDYDYEENDISEYRLVGSIDRVFEIIDKYKAEGSHRKARNNGKERGNLPIS